MKCDDDDKAQDSIYFIEFKIDSTFLTFLNDPNIDTVDRLAENMSYLAGNRNFVMLIRNELRVRRLSRIQAYQRKQTELLSEQTSRSRIKRMQKQMAVVEG